MHLRPRFFFIVLLIIASVFVFNEFLVYYVTISLGCSWPVLSNPTFPSSRVFVISDVHLLGKYRGHWFDKLRREWQMYRCFQSAVQLLGPDAVFFLGDQFDEGLWSSKTDFDRYGDRFDELMYVPAGVRRFAVVGNHDVGFHYELSPQRMDWYSRRYLPELVSHVTIGRSHIVLVNSMAMERDGCRLCHEAEEQLAHLQRRFDCARTARNGSVACSEPFEVPYSRPVLMQHFPLYRRDDRLCAEEEDSAPEPLKSQEMKEKWDCLSAEATEKLLRGLNPRAIFDGHTHFGCKTWWPSPHSAWEWTVPSFSWRNTPQPAFLLVTLSESDLAVSKCLLPNELTVIRIYTITIAAAIICIVVQLCGCLTTRRRKSHPTYELAIVKRD